MKFIKALRNKLVSEGKLISTRSWVCDEYEEGYLVGVRDVNGMNIVVEFEPDSYDETGNVVTSWGVATYQRRNIRRMKETDHVVVNCLTEVYDIIYKAYN